MNPAFPTTVDPNVKDAIATGNFKVIAMEWMALGERFMQSQLLRLEMGRLAQPDDPEFHRPDGFVAQWQAFAAAHDAAVNQAKAGAGVPDALLPWVYPQLDRFVVAFMAAALRSRGRA